MVVKSDSLEFLKKQKDYENDIIFVDPPYGLGSEVIIRSDGKVDYSKATDFMNKWKMPTGEYWSKWFTEAYRVLKHGGYLIMYGIDRQLLIFKYYAHYAGFQEQQSIYWYFTSNFPKAVDLGKMIDKNAGAEREVIGEYRGASKTGISGICFNSSKANKNGQNDVKITAAATELGKKYDGYKYCVAPLKQTCETVMVFKKPNKTGSVLHDVLAKENGDLTIACSALSIDKNRVPGDGDKVQSEQGRYPSQTYIDSITAKALNNQSINGNDCSKILHKCDYEKMDFNLFIHEPKVSGYERNNGLGLFQSDSDPQLNIHPTLKPIDLNCKILKLFKTPNDQQICYAFAGSGSEVIGGLKADFQNWTACEFNQEYVNIANERIKYYQENEHVQMDIFQYSTDNLDIQKITN